MNLSSTKNPLTRNLHTTYFGCSGFGNFDVSCFCFGEFELCVYESNELRMKENEKQTTEQQQQQHQYRKSMQTVYVYIWKQR